MKWSRRDAHDGIERAVLSPEVIGVTSQVAQDGAAPCFLRCSSTVTAPIVPGIQNPCRAHVGIATPVCP